MVRWSRILLLLAPIASIAPVGAAGQATSVLHIRVTLAEADQQPRPIARHALLISNDPPTSAPRLVATGADGTADVHLRPGRYIVESDRPVAFHGKAYSWSTTVTVPSGQDAVLELTSANAEIEAATTAGPAEIDLDSVFEQWQDSVVRVWSDTSCGLGFLIGANGLIATTQQLIGSSTTAEVELAPAAKVAARVLVTNSQRNVAILWVDPKAVATMRPVRLGFAHDGTAPVAAGQPVFSVGSPLHGRKFMTTATVKAVAAGTIDSDLIVDRGNAGAPVFASDGQVIGIATLASVRDDRGPGMSGVVRIDEARAAIADAESTMRGAEPPKGTPLPIEPSRPVPVDALKAAVQARTRNAIDYQLKGVDFDLTFITPMLTYGVQYRAEQREVRKPGTRTMSTAPVDPLLSLESFENWSEYAGTFPPVLMIRATPKLVESFWSVLGRQAAQTQGISLPAGAKHAKAEFAGMRVFCGDAEVTPIHPFKIERHLTIARQDGSADAVAYEGLYVIDPNAIGPQCGAVKVVLLSVKGPVKGDTRVVEPRMVQQIWDDFAPWRAAGSSSLDGVSFEQPALEERASAYPFSVPSAVSLSCSVASASCF